MRLVTLRNSEQDGNEQIFLVEEHVKEETKLHSQATEVRTALHETSHVEKLRAKTGMSRDSL